MIAKKKLEIKNTIVTDDSGIPLDYENFRVKQRDGFIEKWAIVSLKQHVV